MSTHVRSPEHSQASAIEVLGSPDHGCRTVCPLNCDICLTEFRRLLKTSFMIVRVEVRGSSCVRVELGNSSEIPRVSHTSTSSRFAPFHLDYFDEFHPWPISTRWFQWISTNYTSKMSSNETSKMSTNISPRLLRQIPPVAHLKSMISTNYTSKMSSNASWNMSTNYTSLSNTAWLATTLVPRWYQSGLAISGWIVV